MHIESCGYMYVCHSCIIVVKIQITFLWHISFFYFVEMIKGSAKKSKYSHADRQKCCKYHSGLFWIVLAKQPFQGTQRCFPPSESGILLLWLMILDSALQIIWEQLSIIFPKIFLLLFLTNPCVCVRVCVSCKRMCVFDCMGMKNICVCVYSHAYLWMWMCLYMSGIVLLHVLACVWQGTNVWLCLICSDHTVVCTEEHQVWKNVL